MSSLHLLQEISSYFCWKKQQTDLYLAVSLLPWQDTAYILLYSIWLETFELHESRFNTSSLIFSAERRSLEFQFWWEGIFVHLPRRKRAHTHILPQQRGLQAHLGCPAEVQHLHWLSVTFVEGHNLFRFPVRGIDLATVCHKPRMFASKKQVSK